MGSNLLYKASIVTTPTAYGVGVLNSIKPAQSFSEELLANNNFASGYTSWSTYGVTSVSDGIATIGASASSGIFQTILTQGRKYKVTLNVTSYNGVGTADVSDNNGDIKYSVTSIGVQSFIFTQTHSTGEILFRGRSNAIFSLSSVSVVEITDADFDFTRTSSATRVNPDYLIETVSINSANLVQNSNFSELGSQLVTNGDFATDSNWIKGTGWTISGGKAICDGSQTGNTGLQQSGVAVSGKIYKIQFDLTVDAGFINYVNLGGWIDNTNLTTSNTYTYYTTTTTNTDNLGIAGDSNFVGSVDNVSVKQVDPNDNWTLGTGWSLGTDKAICDGSQSSQSNLYQANIVPINKTYKVTFTIVVNAGSMVLAIGGSNAQPTVSSSGTYTFTSKATSGDSNLYFSASSDFIGSITNISVIEIQENGVPRLDYTNGTASILLEPQSTNFVTYSEDFTSWVQADTSTVSIADSFDGSNNAYKVSVVAAGGFQTIRNTGLSVSGVQTFTIYAKKDTLNFTRILFGGFGNFWVDLQNGTQGTTTGSFDNIAITSAGNGFFKIVATFTPTNAVTEVFLYPSIGNGNVSQTSGSVIFQYAQLEQGSFPTSYIPTSGQSGGVTRAAETLNNAGNSDLINSTEGVLYAEVKTFSESGSAGVISLNDGGNTNRVKIELDGGQIKVRIDTTAGQVASLNYTIAITNYLKIAVKWKADDYALWINGIEGATDTSGASFVADTLSKLSFDRGDGGEDFFGRCKTVAVFKEALTDTELACLTSTNNREIFLNYYYRMQYVGANTEALSCAEQTFNV